MITIVGSFDVLDIHPPANVVESMHQIGSAERQKRASILESEGQRYVVSQTT